MLPLMQNLTANTPQSLGRASCNHTCALETTTWQQVKQHQDLFSQRFFRICNKVLNQHTYTSAPERTIHVTP